MLELVIAVLWFTGLGLIAILYGRGWWRLRQGRYALASGKRLAFFCVGLALLLAATLPPLFALSFQFLFVRALQKIMIAMWAAPLLWLACPLQIIQRGLPFAWRHQVTQWLKPERRLNRGLHLLTEPAVAWLGFVSAIVLWHDVGIVQRVMPWPGAHLLVIVLITGIGLLYWGHLVGTGLRRYRRVPEWVLFAYVIGVEIPNMATGMSIAYAGAPLYGYYAATHAHLAASFDVINDQRLSGGLIWFMGSVVFFSTGVLILNRLFRHNKGDSPQHFPDWDSDERMIAPGLEHRLKEAPRK
ncbi:MAG: cytochrome c oxidase assembly protein [Caldilineaceae bacterium]